MDLSTLSIRGSNVVNPSVGQQQSEISREMNRLASTVSTVQKLASEVAGRLTAYRIEEPPVAVERGGPAPVADPVHSAAGREIREITTSLEVAADSLRYQLRTLAV